MKKIFIDGRAGTTGLRIYERINRDDLEMIILSDEERKNPERKKWALNNCDLAFLCLPDDASREAVSMIENDNVVVIDTSTAHRTNPDWAYGFPELGDEFYQKIKNSKRIAVPGCHASGFIALIYPLVKAGLIDKDIALSCFSLTGYSGGGKKMIAEYEAEGRDKLLDAPRVYGISQQHKHLKEMVAITGLDTAPIFCPIVAPFYSGMEVTVPLFKKDLNGSVEQIKNVYKSTYNTAFVSFCDNSDENGFLSSGALSGLDSMQISVFGNDERITLVARYDNLGKGASGAAIECMNIVLGLDKEKGLILK